MSARGQTHLELVSEACSRDQAIDCEVCRGIMAVCDLAQHIGLHDCGIDGDVHVSRVAGDICSHQCNSGKG
jgi:hypothetical protein